MDSTYIPMSLMFSDSSEDSNDTNMNKSSYMQYMDSQHIKGVTLDSNQPFTMGSNITMVSKCVTKPHKKKYINGNTGKNNENYKYQQYEVIKKEINGEIERSGIYIKRDIVNSAINLYHHGLQKNQIHRGLVKKGCQAACLYHMCIEYNIPMKPKEIADIFNIQQKSISKGISIINRLHYKKMIDDNIMHPNTSKYKDKFIDMHCYKINNIYDKPKFQIYYSDCAQVQNYLRRYFDLMGLDASHDNNIFMFCNLLIYLSMKKHISDSSIPSSKCAAVMYLLTYSYNGIVTEDDIINYCQISKGTYQKFTNRILIILRNPKKYGKLYKMIRHLYNKYNVKLPKL